MTDTRDLRLAATELLQCATAWEPNARLLGNVTADEIAAICESWLRQDGRTEDIAERVMALHSEVTGPHGKVLSVLADLWHQHPEQRLCQLVVNVARERDMGDWSAPEVFYMTDEAFMASAKGMAK